MGSVDWAVGLTQRKKRGLTWEGGSVARGLGTPVTAGRRRERRRARGVMEEGSGAACPSLGPSPSPRCLHTPAGQPPPAPSGKGVNEGLTSRCLRLRPLCLQPLHALLQLPDMRLQVAVPGLGLPELTAGR